MGSADGEGLKVMERPLVSYIVWTRGTSLIFFKDCVESVLAQTSPEFELIIFDENPDASVEKLTGEFFANDERLRYRRMSHGSGLSYALNLGLKHAAGDYVFILGQHDRLDERTTALIISEMAEHTDCDVIYTDHDELAGINRTNPHFKPDYSIELLRHTDYIGDFICMRRESAIRLGAFRDNLLVSGIYDFLLRCYEKNAVVRHIPKLLYHLRILPEDKSKEARKFEESAYREYMTVAKAHLERLSVAADVMGTSKKRYWNVSYDGSDHLNHRKEYILIRDDDTRVSTRHAAAELYGYLKQDDVAIVGVRFNNRRFGTENCGYIFDTSGIAYPACHGQSVFEEGYEMRTVLPREVSMVDAAYCMIDSRFYRRAGGFDAKLSGRDLMLDLCLKAIRSGYRVIYLPQITAHKKEHINVSSEYSNELLMKRHGDFVSEGDPFYNKNLPVGLENYYLY